jgi:Rieske Fe-S protein
MTGMDRREFMGCAAGILAAAVLPGCASVAAMRVTPTDGAVRLMPRNHPQLDQPGGYLKIEPDGTDTPIYVLALDGGEYAAVSPICTHLGCTVDIAGERLVCPCHGSTFDRGGAVLRGPAEDPLKRYRATVTAAGELVIDLGGAA